MVNLLGISTLAGKIVAMRATVGLGLKCNIPGKWYFISLFSEVKYGYPIHMISSTPAFENTSVSNQVTVNMGISFGLRF